MKADRQAELVRTGFGYILSSAKIIVSSDNYTMFTQNANKIFAQAIDDYHRYDDVDHQLSNPYAEGTIDHLLYMKNWVDTVQWHLEDIIRDPRIDPVEALKIKRRIDKSNQVRTDMVEYIDSYLLDKY